ncbi:MAG TPA: hypothetical protein GXX39_02400 [Syntrophothermus lipocalidus]|uniref:Uncharacterized protein n=1 Tax=Syntrophothermus lipocalidus (strain DSM 12680 / TGB-C1) TaxID=643648 RepID=D7CPC2_SYNLT|nr:hypothetical protein [Syntrophothermus lipocalidus]ADI02557.1 hypothetical protein Slip_1802 [Syntrophothermus lipocalidus DSM 12680]HHV76209.1 hypothetical protein [Syntrophothermus lipocalidus]
MLFKKRTTMDVAILVNDREIREVPVEDETGEAIFAGGLSLPKADAQVRYFPSGGRAYIYGYTPEYLVECENVARLERSTVLRNLFDYGAAARTANIQFYVMMGALIITIFLLRG